MKVFSSQLLHSVAFAAETVEADSRVCVLMERGHVRNRTSRGCLRPTQLHQPETLKALNMRGGSSILQDKCTRVAGQRHALEWQARGIRSGEKKRLSARNHQDSKKPQDSKKDRRQTSDCEDLSMTLEFGGKL
eukprot:2853806-Rhodomonas_salina.5